MDYLSPMTVHCFAKASAGGLQSIVGNAEDFKTSYLVFAHGLCFQPVESKRHAHEKRS